MSRDTHQYVKPTNAVLEIKVGQKSGYTNDYFHIYARARVVSDGTYTSQPAGMLLWPETGWPYRIPYLAGLTVSCQGNNRDDDLPDGTRGVYAWTVSYGTSTVTTDVAEAMYLTLKRVDAAMAKMAAVEGRAHTFGTYVARVARALGIATLTCPSQIAPDGYRRMNPVEGGEWIDYQIGEWQREKQERRSGTAA